MQFVIIFLILAFTMVTAKPFFKKNREAGRKVKAENSFTSKMKRGKQHSINKEAGRQVKAKKSKFQKTFFTDNLKAGEQGEDPAWRNFRKKQAKKQAMRDLQKQKPAWTLTEQN
jgi:hypothetical protein